MNRFVSWAAMGLCLLLASSCEDDAASQNIRQAPENQALDVARTGAWHGTITITTSASGNYPDPSNNDFSETTHRVNIGQKASLDVNGQVMANVNYSEREDTEFKHLYDNYTITGTQNLAVDASGKSSDAYAKVEIFPDGRYTIDYFASGVDGERDLTVESTLRCKPNVDPECSNRNDKTNERSPVSGLGSVSGGVEGRIDKKRPEQLSGQYTEPYEQTSDVKGITAVNWSLSR